jgi:hypothetical protein
MGIVVILLAIASFFDEFRMAVSNFLGSGTSSSNLIYAYIPAALFVLYVAVEEFPIWYFRLRVRNSMATIDLLEDKYRLQLVNIE